jgi:hypothetical protein
MHVRQGRPGNTNDGCDTSAQLPLNQWSTVNVKLVGNLLTVSVGGKVWCSNKNYWTSDPGRKGVKVYASDPWYNAANARVKDFEYEKVEAPKATPVIQGPAITVRRNNVLKHVSTHAEFTLSMDIKPTGVIGGWSNIVHFTDKHNRNYGHHGSRIPAIWMYSNSARMHVRNGRPL